MSDMLNPQVMNILDVMEYDGEKIWKINSLLFPVLTMLKGDTLIGYANNIMEDIQRRIGGGIIYLDCEDNQHLKNFYIDKNHYKIFGECYSNSDGIRYLQMIHFF